MVKKTCIEVAVNGASTRRVQPRIPVLAKEIIDEGVACIKAGAAVIHAHTLEPDSGKQNGNVDNCVAFMNGIREQVDIPSSRYSRSVAFSPSSDSTRSFTAPSNSTFSCCGAALCFSNSACHSLLRRSRSALSAWEMICFAIQAAPAENPGDDPSEIKSVPTSIDYSFVRVLMEIFS